MQLGWVDYSQEEKEKIKELLKLLGETSALDEMGVGIVRDHISDLLYPGTSVLHTRAKYYILIPELFKKAMESGLTTGKEVRRLIDTEQDKIARALRRAIDEETGKKAHGIIGGRSDIPVKVKPSRIYWNGLRTTGIICNPTLSYDDACSAVAAYNRKNNNIILKSESDGEAADSFDAKTSFTLFTAPCQQSIDDYLKNPTLYLTRDEALYLYDQFLYTPVMKDTLMEYCLKTNKYYDIPLSEIKHEDDMSKKLKNNLMLAVEFADFIYGAYIVYNLLYWENGGKDATDEAKKFLISRYAEWKTSYKGLPHREEILNLVIGHDFYKKTLNEFLKEFEKAVDSNSSKRCSEAEKKVIINRERFCKREKSKLFKDYPYTEIHSMPMNYRHDTAQDIIYDILKGMEQ